MSHAKKFCRPTFSLLVLVGMMVICSSGVLAQQPNGSNTPRERLSLDAGWKFFLGDKWHNARNLAKAGSSEGPAKMRFNDSEWRSVDLPHDWAIELPFDQKADMSHGYRAVGPGFPQNSIAWYRRTFELPKEDLGRRLWLEFDGVYRDCLVFVNGYCLGRQESGYTSFRLDISDVARYGEKNTVAVRVDASNFEGWFYEGAGIYRHVWLVKTSPLSFAPDRTFVYATFKNNVPEGPATVYMNARVQNLHNKEADSTVNYAIYGPLGNAEMETGQSEPLAAGTFAKTARLSPGAIQNVNSNVKIDKPALWSPESPQLYKLVLSVESKGRVVDRTETTFGIRTVAFDADKGFILNGKPYVLKGTCNHQDHAGVGSAVPDRLQFYRIERLKAMGCNSYRTSHNPPTPELLDACDRLGMLVMDENRILGSSPDILDQLEGLVRRDRNHPSVFIWSIANEEAAVHGQDNAGRVADTMQRLVHKLDPSRKVTYAANAGNLYRGINSIIDVRGWNYNISKATDQYHAEHPKQPNVGTEQGSTTTTRGIYFDDKEKGYVTAYGTFAPPWAHRAEVWWSFFAERPWLSGGYVWTGFDYRGEPTPYSWPNINSHFGILDMCGMPKDIFYYYKAWWTNEPTLHIAPHWNWQGKEGQEFVVEAYTNADEVELFLNNESLGTKKVEKYQKPQWKVKYAPGTLLAKAVKNGKPFAETKVETTGEPATLVLEVDRREINADGQDLSIVTVSSTDAQGRTVPTASNLVEFELVGPGKILGVGNGDPSCHESDIEPKRSLFSGYAQVYIQSSLEPGELVLTARSKDMKEATQKIQTKACPPRPRVP